MNNNIIFQATLSDVKREIPTAKLTCCECGAEVELRWVGQQFDGWFMAKEATFSELFDDYLPDPKTIVCQNCFVFPARNLP